MKPFKKPTIAHAEQAIFFRQLVTLLSANIPIAQSCQLLLTTQKNKELHKVALRILYEIERGGTLANGIKKFPQYFSKLIYELIYLGEQTGTLESILERIVLLLEKSAVIKNQIQQTLFYPLLVMAISFIVCFTMLLFIVPRFSDFFASFHGDIPLLTRCLINFSAQLKHNFLLTISLALVVFSVFRYSKAAAIFKKFLLIYFLRIPWAQSISTRFFLYHFAKTFALLYLAGINITDILSLIANTCYLPEHRLLLLRIKDHVLMGQSLYKALQTSPTFSAHCIQMVKIGEESGKLSKTLETLATLYENEINQFLQRFNQLLEPLIMLILGVLIGGLLIAIYLPIFNLGMSI